eukprot:14660365-Heterocapsa_arctica.AAC.1
MPELVVEIEEGLETHRRSTRAHNPRRKYWRWNKYDKIWGFRRCPKRIPRQSSTSARGQMLERNPDTDRCTRFERTQREDGQKKSKQNGKR